MGSNGEPRRFPTLPGAFLEFFVRSCRCIPLGLLALGLAHPSGLARAGNAEWMPSERLHPDTPFDEPVSDISVGPSAEPVSVWEAQGDIWWAQWSSECKCWTTPMPLHPDSRIDEFPRLSIGGDGVPWVVWSRLISFEVGFALLSSRFMDGIWATPDTVIGQSSPSDIYDLHAVTSTDSWVAIHKVSSQHANQQMIFVFHYESGRWVERGVLSGMIGAGHYDMQPSVTVDATGRIWVGWRHQSPGPSFTPYVARREAGQWSAPEPLPLPGNPPELTALADGVGVVWSAYLDVSDRLDVAFRSWNGQWGPLEIISGPDGYYDDDRIPDVASVDGMGPVVIWVAGPRSQPTHMDVVAVHRVAGTWTAEEVISIPDSVELAQDKYARVTLGPDGTAWACWSRLGPWPQSIDEDLWFARGKLYGATAAVDQGSLQQNDPSGFLSVIRAYPTPSSSSVFFDLEMTRESSIDVDIFSSTGNLVRRLHSGSLTPGRHQITWDGRNGWGRAVGSGQYFYRIESGLHVDSGKIFLVR